MKDCPGSAELYHLIFLPTVKEDYEVLKTTLNALGGNQVSQDRIIVVLAGEFRVKDLFLPKAERRSRVWRRL